MSISKDTVKYTAKLARLGLTEEEIELYAKQLSDILGYVDTINSVDTKEIEPASGSLKDMDMTPMREDEIISFKGTDRILGQAPLQENNMFRVPKIMGDDEA